MEQKIEGTVDNFLDSMASELYLGSIWFGLLLILVGAVLLFKKRNSNNNKFVCYACMVIGFLAIVSGLMQLYSTEKGFLNEYRLYMRPDYLRYNTV